MAHRKSVPTQKAEYEIKAKYIVPQQYSKNTALCAKLHALQSAVTDCTVDFVIYLLTFSNQNMVIKGLISQSSRLFSFYFLKEQFVFTIRLSQAKVPHISV